MSCEVYLGNYPSSMTPEDISNMFSQFEGIKILRSMNKNTKCFSFLECVDQQQVVDVVIALHDIDVGGRNLIVRAADRNLQEGINQLLDENGVLSTHPKNNSRFQQSSCNSLRGDKKFQSEPKIFNRVPQQDSLSHPYDRGYQFRQSYEKELNSSLANLNIQSTNPEKSFHRQPKSEGNYPSSQGNKNQPNSSSGYLDSHCIKPEKTFPHHPKSEGDPHFGQSDKEQLNSTSDNLDFECNKQGKVLCHRPKKVNPQSYSGHLSSSYSNLDIHPDNLQGTFHDHEKSDISQCDNQRNPGFNDIHCINPQETFLRHKQKTDGFRDHYKSKGIPDNTEDERNRAKGVEYYVSVFNFPLYSTVPSIYELFSDFNPVYVCMICNKERFDRQPTEAVVIFESQKDATDAILTLDNTYYRSRLILVSDAATALVTDLLSLSKN